jgi:hypothetical protein
MIPANRQVWSYADYEAAMKAIELVVDRLAGSWCSPNIAVEDIREILNECG